MKQLLTIILIAGIFSSCNNMNGNGDWAKKQAKTKEGVQAFYDKVFNAHNPAMIDSFVTADYVEHTPDPRYPATRDGLKTSFKDFFAGFPDVNAKVNFMTIQGDTVIVHNTMTGTNSGAMMGMPPSNKKINVDGVDIIILKGGKATEHWAYGEDIKMIKQLGGKVDWSGGMDTTKAGQAKK